MSEKTISFIGGGNMARSLIGGMINDGRAPTSIWVSDTNPTLLDNLHAQLGVNISNSNVEIAAKADIIMLAVKPQVLKAVAEELRDTVQANKPMVMSVAAGIREQDINRWLGGDVAVVRTMPNTPSLIQAGATALFANAQVSTNQRNDAETIMRTVGLALWLDDEKQMDVVTALSGSGPAYYFLFIEALENAACEEGLSRECARLLALQTAYGATKMALESDEEPAVLRKRVTSPGGTTEQAILSFEENGLRDLCTKAIKAATARSAELAKQLGEQS